jgi:hypothetical protein
MHARPALRVLVTAGALAGLAMPAAANAETFTHSDPTRDVQSFDDTSAATDQPTNKTADVTHLTIRHTSKHMAVTVKLRDLAKTWFAISDVETADTSFTLFGTGAGSSTDFSLAKASGKPITCDAITSSRDKTKRTITFAVPTSCLGNPTWVKVGVGVVVVGSSSMYADDALRVGGGADESDLTLSRKIHRG